MKIKKIFGSILAVCMAIGIGCSKPQEVNAFSYPTIEVQLSINSSYSFAVGETIPQTAFPTQIVTLTARNSSLSGSEQMYIEYYAVNQSTQVSTNIGHIDTYSDLLVDQNRSFGGEMLASYINATNPRLSSTDSTYTITYLIHFNNIDRWVFSPTNSNSGTLTTIIFGTGGGQGGGQGQTTPETESEVTSSSNDSVGPFTVTFLDCNGETVSVQSVAYQGDAVAPTGYGTYEGYTNVSANMDLRPTSCSASNLSGYTVPNTADKH